MRTTTTAISQRHFQVADKHSHASYFILFKQYHAVSVEQHQTAIHCSNIVWRKSKNLRNIMQ